MQPVSDLTYKILAFPQVPIVDTDECIDWAIDMIGLGYEQPELLMLAAVTKPSNFFETMEYLQLALKALKLVPKSGDDGLLSYAVYFIKKISQGMNVEANLNSFARHAHFNCCDGKLDDLYAIWCAWGDLDYGNVRQDYWPEANLSNIVEIATDKAQQWLVSNQEELERLLV